MIWNFFNFATPFYYFYFVPPTRFLFLWILFVFVVTSVKMSWVYICILCSHLALLGYFQSSLFYCSFLYRLLFSCSDWESLPCHAWSLLFWLSASIPLFCPSSTNRRREKNGERRRRCERQQFFDGWWIDGEWKQTTSNNKKQQQKTKKQRWDGIEQKFNKSFIQQKKGNLGKNVVSFFHRF